MAVRLIPAQTGGGRQEEAEGRPQPRTTETAAADRETAAVRETAAAHQTATDHPAAAGHQGFDFLGAITAAGAMLLAAYAVVRLERGLDGWQLTAGTAVAAALLATAFVGVERRSPAPLVRLGILRKASVVRADLGALLFVGAFFGFQFVVTLYLQELRGWSSLQTAIALVVMGCDAILAPTLTPRLVNRFGNGRVILGGFVLGIVAYGLFLPVGMDWTYAAMFPTLLIAGIAFALAYGPLTIAATDGVTESEQGLAGGLLNTATQFGAAFGISAVTAVYGLAFSGSDPASSLSAFRTALIVPVAMVTLGALISSFGLRGGRGRRVAGATAEASFDVSANAARQTAS